MDGAASEGPVLVFDDDHYYMGGLIAEHRIAMEHDVISVTPEPVASVYMSSTHEQGWSPARLTEASSRIVASHTLTTIGDGEVQTLCVYTDMILAIECLSVVLVTSLSPIDEICFDLVQEIVAKDDSAPQHIVRVGDCYASGTIAAAGWSGHGCACEPFAEIADQALFAIERAALSDTRT